ncbi:cell division protein FtsA [Sporolituus thermophilus]|uniref:Cell division protein FtsA n=1 Tax=Sporolituus thermophilus DSM 23256 TaxID=1123285 RepID=A0A1G7I3Q3_9FIRM|nr:cell division protein FtsA [Sporolituus thermophilus]SDF07024.1 cell division protein FtsA [Sporolituus thermophilus DSM 23256]
MDRRRVMGVDLGTNAVKAFAATIDDLGRVEIAGSGLAPATGYKKGILTDPHAAASAIRQAVDCALLAANFRMQPIWLGVGGVGIRFYNARGIIAPASSSGINSKDIDRACQAARLTAGCEGQQILHALPNLYWVDGRQQRESPVGQAGCRLEVEVHFVTASKDFLDELLAHVKQNSLCVAGVVANPVAAAIALAPAPGERVLILDIGAGTTEIALVYEGLTVVSASLPLGGDYITGDIAYAAGVSFTHAEEIKRYYARLGGQLIRQDAIVDFSDFGITNKFISYGFLHKIVQTRVDEIFSLVYDYIRPALQDYPVDEIALTGGSAHLPSVVQAAKTIFQLPVRIRQPKGLAAEYNHPANTVCFGIVHYAARQASFIETTRTWSWRGLWRKIAEHF